MSQPVTPPTVATPTNKETPICQSEWGFFAFVAGVILPGLLVGSLIVYGFVVWFMQIFFFGPPSA